jgi:hypothetical protein
MTTDAPQPAGAPGVGFAATDVGALPWPGSASTAGLAIAAHHIASG